jgi:hypothetical protein
LNIHLRSISYSNQKQRFRHCSLGNLSTDLLALPD